MSAREPLTHLVARLRRVEAQAVALYDHGNELEALAAGRASQRIQRRMIRTKPRTVAGVAILLRLAAEHSLGCELEGADPASLGDGLLLAALRGAEHLAP